MSASWKRSRYCGEVSLRQSGEAHVFAGWVQRRRDLGGLIFLDLRDRTGIVQVVVNPQEAPQAYGAADQIRNEFVVAVRGVVRPRPEGTVNPKIPTGEVEVRAEALDRPGHGRCELGHAPCPTVLRRLTESRHLEGHHAQVATQEVVRGREP